MGGILRESVNGTWADIPSLSNGGLSILIPHADLLIQIRYPLLEFHNLGGH